MILVLFQLVGKTVLAFAWYTCLWRELFQLVFVKKTVPFTFILVHFSSCNFIVMTLNPWLVQQHPLYVSFHYFGGDAFCLHMCNALRSEQGELWYGIRNLPQLAIKILNNQYKKLIEPISPSFGYVT